MELKEGYIICSKLKKTEILRENNTFKDYHFLSLAEFNRIILGYCTKEGTLFLHLKYNFSFEVIKIYTDSMMYIENKRYNNQKLDFLVELKNELIENNFWIKDQLLFDLLKKINITFIDIKKDKNLTKVINIIDNKNLFFIESDDNVSKKLTYYSFSDIENEMDFVCNEIKNLIDKGISPNDIKIVNANSDYEFLLNRFIYSLNLPILLNNEKNLLTKKSAKEFLSLFDKYEKIEDLFEYINLNSTFINKKDLVLYTGIINSYNGYKYTPYELKECVKYELSNMSFDYSKYEEYIEIIGLNDLKNISNEYVFLLNFDTSVPNSSKDLNYLSDNELDILNVNTVYDKNKKNHDEFIKNLYNTKNIVITFSTTHSFSTRTISNLASEIGIQEIKKESTMGLDEITDSINLARSFDDYNNYGIKSSILKDAFDIKYNSYDNNFKAINQTLYNKNKPNKFNLSYTSLNQFFSCPFQFFMNYLMNLNSYEDQLYFNIGNIAHKILEDSYNEDFKIKKSYDVEIENILKKRKGGKITEREKYFFNRILTYVEECINQNKDHEALSKLDSVKTEETYKVEINDDINFIGKVDKTLYSNKEKKFIIVDYKTGKTNFSLNNLEDGLNLQLPIYIFLLKNSSDFSNYEPIGVYLEHINIEKGNKISAFKLEGFSSSTASNIELIDPNFTEDNSYIAGLKYKSGTQDFYASSLKKILTKKDFEKIDKILKSNIEYFSKCYKNASFEIKYANIENEQLNVCNRCKMKDICFKTARNKNKLSKKEFENGEM